LIPFPEPPKGSYYWLKRKNTCVPVMGLVTVFCPLTRTGGEEFVIQTAGGARLVVDCKVNPTA
jgi:hypothetical protein